MVTAARLWCNESPEGRESEAGLRNPTTEKLSLNPKANGTVSESGKNE